MSTDPALPGATGDDVSRGTSPDGDENPFAALLERFEEGVCENCGTKFGRHKGTKTVWCPACVELRANAERVARESAAIMAEFMDLSRRWLTDAGLTRREILATRELIPKPLMAVLRERAAGVGDMLAGKRPARGFGLSGAAGTGKTMALSAIVQEMHRARWHAAIPKYGRAALSSRWLGWVAWPETVNRLRVMSMRDGGLDEANDQVEAMAEMEVLVIDDLGVERMRGDYSDDWAASQLDHLVNARYNEMRPTWYTTNLSPEEFGERYGSRLYSRLCGENPLLVVPAIPDLRINTRRA